jgi:hypothetical protein
MKVTRSRNQLTTPVGPIYRPNEKTKMPLWAEKEITANEGYFCPTFTTSHPTPINRLSSALLPRDLRDDATCTIRVAPLPILRLDWETLS